MAAALYPGRDAETWGCPWAAVTAHIRLFTTLRGLHNSQPTHPRHTWLQGLKQTWPILECRHPVETTAQPPLSHSCVQTFSDILTVPAKKELLNPSLTLPEPLSIPSQTLRPGEHTVIIGRSCMGTKHCQLPRGKQGMGPWGRSKIWWWETERVTKGCRWDRWPHQWGRWMDA